MKRVDDWLSPLERGPRHTVAWLGGLVIAAIVALALYDIVRSYHATIDDTGRELDSQARVLAEQTARSMQAIDVVLRHLVERYQSGSLARASGEELHAYLKEQAVGLVQADGLVVIDPSGGVRAMSLMPPGEMPPVTASGQEVFQRLRADPGAALVVGSAVFTPANGQWVFPIGRRLSTPTGAFAGVVGARGRVEYFQRFYGDAYPDKGTRVALLHENTTLLARHPPANQALGRSFPIVTQLLAAAASGVKLTRNQSPLDGADRFGAVRRVPDYPLSVIVTRDVDAALAPWREQALGSVLRTLALATLAALLMAVVLRQLARLDAARASLESSRERFALAVAGSDDGLWDWNYQTAEAFASSRARTILGLLPGPELQPLEDWMAQMARQLHPADLVQRNQRLAAHMAGDTPAYEGEWRVRVEGGDGWRWVRVRGVCVRDAGGYPLRIAGSVSDIDARKRAEDALRLSEERYALSMTGSTGGHWVLDVATDALFVSSTLNQLFDLPPDTQAASRTEYFRGVALHPDDRELFQRMNDGILQGRMPRADFEYRVVLPGHSEPRWILARAQSFRDAEGRVVRVAGVSVDISARKRTEQALRESEERFALAVAGSNDGILDWDVVNDRMFTSERAMRIAGVQADGLVRTRAEWVALLQLHPDDAQRHTDDFHRHIEGETAVREGEYRVRHPDGQYRWVRLRTLSVRDEQGRALRWAGSVSDIDAQKRTEEALRSSEERYQLAVDGSNQGLWDWDLASDMLFLSPRAQQLNFYEPGEPLRPRREWIALTEYHPDDLHRVQQTIGAHLRGETPEFVVEYRVRHHSGAWHWYRQRGLALRDASGRAYRMAGSMEDISAPKQAEAHRDRLEAQLRQAQKLEAIGTLAGGIAHDFNNILSAILGYGEMAQKEAAEGTQLRRRIDAALSAALRAKSLVERILAFSRSGMGERVPVHVQSVVAEALDGVAASLPAGIVLSRHLDAGDAAVLGDPTQIHQVVMNLCANAVQAMKGEGSLTVSIGTCELTAPLTVATSVLAPGGFLRLTVADTGSGIAPEVRERIFDPFFTTKDIGVGTGLGLSLVHGIVTDLGGGIDVDSRPGEGATFTVYLPHRGDEAQPVVAEEEAIAPGAGETVLLVDDEEALVRLGEELLAELGYEPVGYSSSRLALEAFRAAPDRFQLVLSDEAMPDMTGSELVAQIRAIRPTVPIVLMSGFVTASLAARAREAGVAEVLAKPLVSRDIARSLAGALRAGAL